MNKFLQKGLREPLLCDECEQRISIYERYVSLVLNGGIGISYKKKQKKLFLTGLDYQKFKLFQLSVLWRASVSSLSAFRQVSLGPHEPHIRKMLITGDPGPPSKYGCLMFVLTFEEDVIQDLIVEPTWARLDGHYCYRFVFGGLVWVYLVSGHAIEKYIADNFVQLNGACTIRLQDMREMKFLVNTIQQLHNLGKIPE